MDGGLWASNEQYQTVPTFLIHPRTRSSEYPAPFRWTWGSGYRIFFFSAASPEPSPAALLCNPVTERSPISSPQPHDSNAAGSLFMVNLHTRGFGLHPKSAPLRNAPWHPGPSTPDAKGGTIGVAPFLPRGAPCRQFYGLRAGSLVALVNCRGRAEQTTKVRKQRSCASEHMGSSPAL